RLNLTAAPGRPHPGTQQPFVLGHRVQLVLDPRTHAHQPATVQQQLPQLLVLHRRLPDCRKSILHQQRQNVPGIPLVGLLLAWTAGPDRARVPQQKLVTQLLHQAPEPTKVPCSLGANPHLPAGQRPVKLLRLLRMVQAALTVLARLLVDKGDLLKTWMEITSYNHHARLLSSRALGRFAATSLLGPGGADAV